MRSFLILVLLLALSIVAFFANVAFGASPITFSDLWSVLFSNNFDPILGQIIYDLRLPRAITAVVAGVALSLAGLVMQTVFRNPLAGPYVLGVSSGASLGVALVLLLGFGSMGILPAATLGSLMVMLVVVFAARRTVNTVSLLVIGLMIGYLVDSLVSLMIHFGDPERLASYVGWGFGSFSRCRGADLLSFSSITIIATLAILPSLKYLNNILLGEESARSLGFSLAKHRVWVLTMASALAAAATVYCGPIGFLGLVVPHLARHFFRTADHRILIPAVMLIGSTMALFSGWVVNLPTKGGALPLNAITAFLGGPVVLWAMLKSPRGVDG
ncbi:MAG: iron ABC transporter permease [Fibrobacter sp.]|nr:iron ABC transporter permease [Fibrobacter sp.]